MREKLITQTEIPEEQIIDNIIANMQTGRKDEYYPKALVYDLEYGQKRLAVYYEKDIQNVETYLDNIKDGSEKKENETSLLYKAAKKLIQQFADDAQQKIGYTLFTKFEKMRDWATSYNKGRLIFDWDIELKHANFRGGENFYEFHAIICPRKIKRS
ncbi:MAG: hypothetical protein PHT51_04205 [Patescibacteria group bacterium]|nr:hypothetical protein [Patescibacteria group bacterium]MDD4610926.1 hypothetical protein [Patescibacteria group bacterium]